MASIDIARNTRDAFVVRRPLTHKGHEFRGRSRGDAHICKVINARDYLVARMGTFVDSFVEQRGEPFMGVGKWFRSDSIESGPGTEITRSWLRLSRVVVIGVSMPRRWFG